MKKDKTKNPLKTFKKVLIAGALCCTMAFGAVGLTGCSDGVDGKDGAQWYSGVDTPTTQGVNGDFYIDTDDYILYQKTNGQWSPIMYDFGKPATATNIELQVDSGKVQWRYTSGDDTAWKNLMLISSLKGTDGATWLSGTTEPTTAEGKNGDFYLNESNYDIYKKTDGDWSKIGNIKGDDGEDADQIISITSKYEKDLTTNEEYYVFTFHFASGTTKDVRVEIPSTIIRIELLGDKKYSRYLESETLPKLQLKCYYTDGTTEDVDVTDDMFIVDDTHVKPDFTIAGNYKVKISYQKCVAEAEIEVYNGILVNDVLSKYDVQLHSTLNSNDGKIATDNKGRFAIADYLEIDLFDSISTNSNYCMSVLAYDKDQKFIGNGGTSGGNWLEAGTSFKLSTIFDWTDSATGKSYDEAKYFRVVFKKSNGANLESEDLVNSEVTLNYKSGAYSYSGYAMNIGNNKCTTNSFNYEKVATMRSSQDGAILGDYIFSLTSTGTCYVNSLSDYSSVSSFVLDKNSVISPHSNSVCFGSNYYQNGDEFPLLYANIYNNNTSMPGVCNVYRIQRDGTTFTSTLVQVIKIGFTENADYWCDSTSVRPYGNFLVDTDNNKLYAYVMMDKAKATRYFKFNIPALADGVYNDTYGVNVVTLNISDIISKFDVEYSNYIQGGCYYDGKIYSLEGFSNDANNVSKLKVIDLENERQITIINLYEAGLTKEPEMIFISEDILYISMVDGSLYKFDFV